SAPPPAPVVVAAAPAASGGVDVKALLSSNGCTACHGVSNKIVGPGFTDILAKHKGKADLEAYLAAKIKAGGSGVFGAVPMPPQPQLKDAEAQAIARWIAAGPR
uniref:c-type cytochrome n=2 Tax=Hydrogenophaga TaxID=47420 RepID=UPI00301D558B